jgi:hypothetical protein
MTRLMGKVESFHSSYIVREGEGGCDIYTHTRPAVRHETRLGGEVV